MMYTGTQLTIYSTGYLIEEDIFSVDTLHCIVLEYTLCDKTGKLYTK